MLLIEETTTCRDSLVITALVMAESSFYYLKQYSLFWNWVLGVLVVSIMWRFPLSSPLIINGVLNSSVVNTVGVFGSL